MNRSSISWILFLLVMSSPLCAQAPLHVGWFDFADERSQTTGLATHLSRQQNVRSHPFKLNVPSSFRPELYDVIVIASFSEFHPNWDQFVQREKSRIDEFIQRGGSLVQMCRYRKNDDKGRLSLLPRGFTVDRGKKDIRDGEWYVSYTADPIWRGFGKDKRNGWNRLPKTKIGPRELDCGLDGFEKWSRNFTRSSDLSMNNRARYPRSFALTADHGRGRILLFQLILDKVDQTRDSLAKKQCREFFATLMAYLKTRTRIARPEIKQDPKPIIVPKIKEPKIAPPPRTYRLRGKVFYDANRNGTLDNGESVARQVALRFEGGTTKSDSNGGYGFEVSNERPSQVFVDLPSSADAKSRWFFNLNAGAAKNPTVLRDIPILPRSNDGEGGRRILVATLPKEIGTNGAALLELGLSQAISDSNPELVVFLSPGQDSRSVRSLRARLERVANSNNVGFRLLSPLPTTGRNQVSRLYGNDRLVHAIEKSLICMAAGKNLDRWLPSAATGVSKDSLIFISGAELQSNQVALLAPLANYLIMPQVSKEQALPEQGPRLAPIFLDGERRDQTAQYLLLIWAETGLEIVYRPETKEVIPALPEHPLGRGDLDELLKEAGKGK
ncbi:MAG: hypothetical protein ACI97A_002023 [Planctomycetota bacterium]|jgi:hypothetical protein